LTRAVEVVDAEVVAGSGLFAYVEGSFGSNCIVLVEEGVESGASDIDLVWLTRSVMPLLASVLAAASSFCAVAIYVSLYDGRSISKTRL
jgi:hypothetical protein